MQIYTRYDFFLIDLIYVWTSLNFLTGEKKEKKVEQKSKER